MKISYEKNVSDKEILQASRNVKPPIAKATHKHSKCFVQDDRQDRYQKLFMSFYKTPNDFINKLSIFFQLA